MVRWEDLDRENVKTGKCDRYQKFPDHEANCFLQVTRNIFRNYAENSTANHSEEKCFFPADFLHQNVSDKVAWQLDEADDDIADVLVPILEVNGVDVEPVVHKNGGEPKVGKIGDLEKDPERYFLFLNFNRRIFIFRVFQLNLFVKLFERIWREKTSVRFRSFQQNSFRFSVKSFREQPANAYLDDIRRAFRYFKAFEIKKSFQTYFAGEEKCTR